MKARAAMMVMVALLMLAPTIHNARDGVRAGTLPVEASRQDGSGAELVLDRVVEVPPGGETRLVLSNGSDPYLEGYIGPSEFNYGKLSEAAGLLPDWLRDDFVRNMLKAGSEELTVDRAPSPTDPFRFNFIPSFGDLDGDGDEDMVVGLDGDLLFYKNVGSAGYPIFISDGFEWVHKPNPGTYEWMSPEICDIDGDPYGDIVFGTEDESIRFMRNPAHNGPNIITGISLMMGGPLEDHLSPTIFSREGSNLTILIGCRNGLVYSWLIELIITSNSSETMILGAGTLLNTMKTLNYSAPRVWPNELVNGSGGRPGQDIGISVGGGDGTLQFFQYAQGQSGGPGPWNIIPNYFQNIDLQGPLTPAPFDLDGDTSPDLVLGTRDPFMPEFINYHAEDINPPYWAPSPTIVPPSPIENYLSVFDRRFVVYNESLIERYLDSIISPTDARYRDEIGFACAYTPPEMLTGNGLANIFNDNAYYIYSRDSELEYVSLKEYDGDDYHTTASYWVDAGGTLKLMEIPMDAYYWGIVHPRITEEMISYIDPESGGPELPENGGRFWREYIYEVADDAYPPGPEFPANYTGRYVYYPKDFAPPLLKDELKDVEVLWDLQPYEYPGGFNDAGTAFNYPTGHKIHAIEKVSQWVERTLPLNQQESLDDERPNQPVRIAHTHNGNCGELQDLTVAAARSALIPARGINLPGEDHAWSEFYCGGWQQWDNYWSDGGGVVANDMTYWWGWGNRGGSGIYASMGTGETVDVGERYRSPDVDSYLLVDVQDKNGNPVDGARVVLLSHWMMDNVNLDVGPYQGPPPVTVPFPSIWGYTDDQGLCRLTCGAQDFNLEVTSEFGHYYSEKFTIAANQHEVIIVSLQGIVPQPHIREISENPIKGGEKYLISAEVQGSYQNQNQFLTGESYRENILNGEILVEIQDSAFQAVFSNIYFSTSLPLLLPLEVGNDGIGLRFEKNNGVKTNTIVRIKVYRLLEDEMSTSVIALISNPLGRDDNGFQLVEISDPELFTNDPNSVMEKIIGWIIDLSGNISKEDYSLEAGGESFTLYDYDLLRRTNFDNWNYEWAFSWISSSPLRTLDPGSHIAEIVHNGNDGIRKIFTSSLFIRDDLRPYWQNSDWDRSVPWGGFIDFDAEIFTTQTIEGFGWLDSKLLWAIDLVENSKAQLFGGSVDTSTFGPGGHQLRLAVLDLSDNLRTFSFPTSFVPSGPLLNITSPTFGYGLSDDQLVVRARATDDILLQSLMAEVNGTIWDLTSELDPEGFVETVLDIDEAPGPLTLVLTATDNVGLVTMASVNFTLLAPPDTTKPAVEITDPSSGKKVTIGEPLTVRGRAVDDTSIVQLRMQSPSGNIDLLPGLTGNSWSVVLDTSSWSEGTTSLSVRGVDRNNNIGSDEIDLDVVSDATPFRDRADPIITVLSPSENDPVELGTPVTLEGRVEDDGTIVRFEISLDSGDSFKDIIASMGEDGSFSLKVDTSELPQVLSLGPLNAKDVLDGYGIILMAQDGADRTTYVGHRLQLRDTRSPEASVERLSYVRSGGGEAVSFDLMIKDGSAPGPASASVIDDEGRTISVWEIGQGRFDLSDGEWKASTSKVLDLPSGEYEVKVVVRDVYGNAASVSRTLEVEEDEGDGGIPVWFYLAAGGGAILLLLAALFLVSVILSNVEKNRKKHSPDGDQASAETTKV